MPLSKYIILEHTFSSKAALKAFIRTILAKYTNFEPLNDFDFRFMCKVLERHPFHTVKKGVGVARMWVQVNKPHNTRGFWLLRIDGSTTDFSFITCVDGSTNKRDFIEACRRDISQQVIRFKTMCFEVGARCAITGVPLKNFSEAHVDHAPPKTFSWLVEEFIRLQGIDIETIKTAGDVDACVERRIDDPVLREAWQNFHADNAMLRLLSVEAHLKAKVTK